MGWPRLLISQNADCEVKFKSEILNIAGYGGVEWVSNSVFLRSYCELGVVVLKRLREGRVYVISV